MSDGGTASNIVVSRFTTAISAMPEGDGYPDTLLRACQVARQEMIESVSDPARPMGSTCTAVVLLGSVIHVCSIGDTRAYLIRGDTISRLTADHTAYEEELRQKEDDADLPDPELRAILLRAIWPLSACVPDLIQFEWASGDVIVVCCDGVWQFVDEGYLEKVFSDGASLEGACNQTLAEAIRQNTNDNVTVAALRIAPAPDPSLASTRPPPVRRKLRLFLANATLVIAIMGVIGYLIATQHVGGREVPDARTGQRATAVGGASPFRHRSGGWSEDQALYQAGRAIRIAGQAGTMVTIVGEGASELSEPHRLSLPVGGTVYFRAQDALTRQAYYAEILLPRHQDTTQIEIERDRDGRYAAALQATTELR